MKNEKENIDLNEGDFIEVFLYPQGCFFGRVIKKYESALSSYLFIVVCDYYAKNIFYKTVRVCEGNVFVIQDASNFSEDIKGQQVTIEVSKIEDSNVYEITERLLREINRRTVEEIMRRDEVEKLFRQK